MAEPGPRLLTLEATMAYLSVSESTVRSWWAAGLIHVVRPVDATGRRYRRLLFDRAELDALVEASKETA